MLVLQRAGIHLARQLAVTNIARHPAAIVLRLTLDEAAAGAAVNQAAEADKEEGL